MSLQPGDTIEGKYRIVRLIGEGGMGAVFEGENIRIHRKVAIKILHSTVASQSDAVQRFEREAQAAGRIGSEHIVEVLDLGSLADGERFMVMEFLDGESLGSRIERKKRISAHEMAHVLHQLLEGLAAAHAARIIHRDLKPDNVFLVTSRAGKRDFVKIVDFGVSKFSSLESDMSMTKTGAVMGTPFYMSPEQARGSTVDFRSDLYAAGVVAYEAVTGRVPFNAETFNELVFKIALESPEPAELVAPGLDLGFAAIISRAMVREVAGRFQTAREFQAAVEAWMLNAAPDPTYDTSRLSAPVGMLRGNTPALLAGSGSSLGPDSRPGPPSSQRLSQPLAPTSTPLPLGMMGQGPTSTPLPLGMMGQAPSSSRAALGQSAPVLGQSGLDQRESIPQRTSTPPLNGSQTDMAMTSPAPRKSGTVVAISLVALAIAGGSFGAYRAFLAKPQVPAAAPPEVPAIITAAPSVVPAPSVDADPPKSSAAPLASETEAPAPPPAIPTFRLGKPWPRSTASAVTAKPTSAPASTPAGGRVIGSEL